MIPSDLYAGKMHALIFRQWKNRIKGRDWYDFEWYVRSRIPLDFAHLNERAKEFNGIEFTKEDFIKMLKERFSKRISSRSRQMCFHLSRISTNSIYIVFMLSEKSVLSL